MRVVKEAEERRNEILDTANELFNEKGYDNTSIIDIIERIGIAKGTLYYHFKSKEEIMNANIERITAKLLANAELVAADSSLGVHEKIIGTIRALNLEEDKGREVMKHIHNPRNALMHQKQLDAIINGVTPVLGKVIEEGIKEGLFNTPYPYEVIEMIIIYIQIAFDKTRLHSEEEAIRKVTALIFILEQLLQAEPGSFNYIAQLME